MKKTIALFLALIVITTGCNNGGSSSSAEITTAETTQNSEIATTVLTDISTDISVDDPESISTVDENTEELEVVSTNGINDVNRQLSNPNATNEAKILYKYINEIYGTSILSGQQESTWKGTPEYEMNYISEVSGGKLPAIRGLDYINEDFDGVTERSIEWWEKGGIVSICWHWGTPPSGVGYDSSKGEIDLDEALTEGTDLYNGMIAQMDRVAEELLELQEAGVPVLWRPFHEFDGAWFWWGKGGSENFIKLWKLMYDRYTNHWGLNNLIWVLGYSHKCTPDWYPGDEYVDVSGADNYATGTEAKRYRRIQKYVAATMPLAFHECGTMPDPDELVSDEAYWAWFLTWHTNFIMDENEKEQVNKIYNHDYVITLDELPDFKSMS